MAGRIPQHFIDELIARADIVEIVGSRVPLKKAGREYKACCPFHGEKTPSFWVSPDKQFFHCFGCGAHGTALGFLMQYDQLPFPEAVAELAERLGMEVPQEPGAAPAQRADEKLFDLLGRVANHWRSRLAEDARARAYVARRGLNAEILERFAIGYAVESWNEVLRKFGGNDEERRALSSTGLIIEREQNAAGNGEHHYDRFRGRIMFPIRDTRGRVIAFGGRVLDKGEPKYLNSPETELFHKGRELYGLYETRLTRTPLRQLMIVEGYMDVVRLHQAGIHYAVATLGTATTPEHLRRVFRLVNTVSFCFDGDRAGRGAAWRALQNVLPEVREGREIRFLFLPDGEDPDSLVGRIGAAAFEELLAGAQPLSEYLIAHLAEQVELGNADGKAHFLSLVRPLLARLPQGVYRELLLERLAQTVELGTERLRALLGESGTDSGSGARAAASYPERQAPRATRREARLRGGRGGLVTQSIQLLLQYPGAVNVLDGALISQLDGSQTPGAPVLRELLGTLQAEPALSVAVLLERWRERPEFARLSALAAAEPLVPDAGAAGRELAEGLGRMIEEEQRQGRYKTLLARPLAALSEQEKLELQELTKSQATARNDGGPRV
ncbi:MAG: DNA primase [Steroidobacteraceae bacterium]